MAKNGLARKSETFLKNVIDCDRGRFFIMSINYNKLAREYDLSRRSDMSTDIRLASDAQITPNNEFIRLVENKGFSIFHLITEEEYEKGLV